MAPRWIHAHLSGFLRSPRSIGQSAELVEDTRNELLTARIPSFQRGGEELNEIPRLRCRFRPRCRRSGEEKILELLLAMMQSRLIDLNLMEAPTNFCGFLGGHAAMLVEVDRIVRHGHLPFLVCDIGSANGPAVPLALAWIYAEQLGAELVRPQ